MAEKKQRKTIWKKGFSVFARHLILTESYQLQDSFMSIDTDPDESFQ